MWKTIARSAVMSCPVAFLVSVGGCGDDEATTLLAPPATILSSKADVQRELGNFGAATITSGSDTGTFAARRSAAYGKRRALLSPAQFGARPRTTASPKAAQTTNCATTGTETVDSGTKVRHFAFFGVERMVGWVLSVSDNCSETFANGDGTTTTFASDGAEEDGQSSDQYYYAVLGSGNTPLTLALTEKNASGVTTGQLVSSTLGSIEEFDSSVADVRIRASIDLSETAEGQTLTGSFVVGDGSPMRLTTTSDNIVTIDGPLSYETSAPACPGGSEEFATLEPIPLDSNDYPVGGVLRITSGSSSVTVTFNADGSAALAFSNGTSASMTAAEVRAGVDAAVCSLFAV
jgi:hypothetical protein